MNVKELREARGWSQMELALKMGCTVRSVQYWETGHNIPESKMKRLEAVFSGKEPVIAKASNHSTSVAAAQNATGNIGGAQQQALDKIYGEIEELRRLMQNDCTAKNAVIKELLALLKKQ